MEAIIKSSTPTKSSLDSGLNKQTSSKRLRNSGLNSPLAISSSIKASLKSSILAPEMIFSRIVLAPALEVAIIMQSRKLISRFFSSRRMPSSRTWSKVVSTDGWAFSISSKSTTENGCLEIWAVRLRLSSAPSLIRRATSLEETNSFMSRRTIWSSPLK